MLCRNCGTDIADKALICYKCGTATTKAKYQPAALPRTASRSGLVATVVALVLLVAAALYIERASSADTSWVTYAAVAVSVIIIGIRAYARRR